MANAVTYYAGDAFVTTALNSNGIGFYNTGGFGTYLPVGTFNSRTFIVDPSGLSAIAEVDNCKYANLTGVTPGQTGTLLTLDSLPNYQSTFEIRATFDSAVRTTNAKLYVYDGVSTSNLTAPSTGVRTAVYECAHLATTQTPGGSGGPGTPIVSGAHAWYLFESGATVTPMNLTASPGLSGTRPSGSGTVSNSHSWYIAMSVTPASAGAKQWGCAASLDWL